MVRVNLVKNREDIMPSITAFCPVVRTPFYSGSKARANRLPRSKQSDMSSATDRSNINKASGTK